MKIATKKGRVILGIALVAILLVSIFGALVPTSARDAGGNILKQDVVYQGERGLDVSDLGTATFLLYGMKDTIADGQLITVATPSNFAVSTSYKVGPYNITSREGTVADMIVEAPEITADVFLEGTTDSIVGMSIPRGTKLAIRVEPNFGGLMKNAADGSWSKVKIRLIDPDGIYMSYIIDADAQQITVGPTVWDQ